MTPDLFDMATREAIARARCTGSVLAPRYYAHVYAKAVMRLVEVGRRQDENFYDAYRRAREQPTATLVALMLIHREQFARERRAVMH